MRKREYISPTSINLFHENRDEFYIRYLSDNRPPREPQTRPMSVGSAFDAFVKSFLHEALFGKNHKDSEIYSLDNIFVTQVEEHNRDWAFRVGKYTFDCYKECGALADLLLDLRQAVGEPRFEIELKGEIGLTSNVQGAYTLLGKPDVFFMNKDGFHTILDFKVNGFCSKGNTSPKRGYLKIRDCNTRQTKDHHKDAVPMRIMGMMINVAHNLEDIDEQWAGQTASYGWLAGAEVGEPFLVGIDQIVANQNGPHISDMPPLRIAHHRTRVSRDFQFKFHEKAKECWDACNNPEKYWDQNKMIVLDARATELKNISESDNPDDALFLQMSRQ